MEILRSDPHVAAHVHRRERAAPAKFPGVFLGDAQPFRHLPHGEEVVFSGVSVLRLPCRQTSQNHSLGLSECTQKGRQLGGLSFSYGTEEVLGLHLAITDLGCL